LERRIKELTHAIVMLRVARAKGDAHEPDQWFRHNKINREELLGRFHDEQFELQLELQRELEELRSEEIRQRARDAVNAVKPSRERRIDDSLRVWAALLRSPVISYEEAEARFEAWCEGMGLTVREVLDDLNRTAD
jgi:hypothetical protein